MKTCYTCFKEFDESYDICPHCGTIATDKPAEPIHLVPGIVLQGRYLLGQAVGSGGFGIIYRAYDLKLETVIAVKEFFSPKIMTRAVGESQVIVSKKSEEEFIYRKDRFLAEARNMAKFGDHRSIPNVFEFFEENGTAYIVMELLNGIALNSMLSENDGKIDRNFAIYVINEVGQALISLHEKNIIHRDVAPDNIFICSEKELKVKLLDLGAAKLSNDDDTVVDIILKPGYSPIEQYDSSGAVGVWSDVYALGATLYVMLTGVKPDESTNRRIVDNLIPPHEIDESISENLSNAIMKAMALDRHMRFSSIKDFLKAVNGEKKVLTLSKEKKRRKNSRVIGILVVSALLICCGLFLGQKYKSMEVEAYLDDATISVWYEAEEGSNEETAMNQIVADFCSKYENIRVDISRFSPDEYAKEIETAAENNQLPLLFESTNVSDNVLSKALDVEGVINSEQGLGCLFLTDEYKEFYSLAKKIPLGFEVPVAIVITGGEVCIPYSGLVFDSLSDFAGTNVSFDSDEYEFLSKSFEIPLENSAEFGKESAVLITSSIKMSKYEQELMSNEWHYSYCTNSKGRFVYEWSLGSGSDKEEMAAERLLSWMLGNAYQNALMVSWAQNGEIPLSKKCFEEYTSLSSSYDGLKDILDIISFEK